MYIIDEKRQKVNGMFVNLRRKNEIALTIFYYAVIIYINLWKSERSI